ncbi:MAG: Gfo/Idh/MocA family oxidoreductase [Planctomycetota bacterium]
MATPRVKVFGAGSAGNHLAHASRSMNFDVVVCDVDEKALSRMSKDLYQNRYGRWDPAIQLFTNDKAPKGGFDYILIATPPENQMALAMEALEEKPKAILVEKMACPPHMELAHEVFEAAKAAGVRAFAGYDHVVWRAQELAEEQVSGRAVGDVLTVDVEFREHWKPVLDAHPWWTGPGDAWLGHWERGGGAGGEHSSALNLWQHWAHVLGKGRVSEVEAMVTYVKDGKAHYDSIMTMNLRSEKGLQGRVVQDVVTRPAKKQVNVQGTEGRIEMVANHSASGDAVFLYRPGMPDKITPVHKKRPEDFIAEVRHIWSTVKDNKPSAIDLQRGLDTALVIAAAHESEARKTRVKIDWTVGYTPEAIVSCG